MQRIEEIEKLRDKTVNEIRKIVADWNEWKKWVEITLQWGTRNREEEVNAPKCFIHAIRE